MFELKNKKFNWNFKKNYKHGIMDKMLIADKIKKVQK